MTSTDFMDVLSFDLLEAVVQIVSLSL
ncbi:unnamed protein product, partial [Rotaria magnacalcarata]